MKLSILDFFRPNPQKTENLATFAAEEILKGKLHFLCSDTMYPQSSCLGFCKTLFKTIFFKKKIPSIAKYLNSQKTFEIKRKINIEFKNQSVIFTDATSIDYTNYQFIFNSRFDNKDDWVDTIKAILILKINTNKIQLMHFFKKVLIPELYTSNRKTTASDG